MKDLDVFLAFPALAICACVNSSNLCAPGYEYVAQGDYCALDDAGAEDAGAPAADPPPPGDGDASDSTDADSPNEAGSGLGDDCNTSSDCKGAASFCLTSPTAPTAGGYCTLTNCTAATCTSAYACCTCTSAGLPALQAWPAGVCAPTSDEALLTSVGCTCQ